MISGKSELRIFEAFLFVDETLEFRGEEGDLVRRGLLEKLIGEFSVVKAKFSGVRKTESVDFSLEKTPDVSESLGRGEGGGEGITGERRREKRRRIIRN